MSKLPNFITVNYPKCGTTSLDYYLYDYTDILMSRQKELYILNAKRNLQKNLINIHIIIFMLDSNYYIGYEL